MLESGVKLGVSSRGSGNVNEGDGKVSDFEIVTVDVVAQPSAPNAYPTAIYEGLMNMRGGSKVFEMAKEASADQKVQKYLKEAVTGLIKDLKIKQEITMLDAIKPLLDSGIINEETQASLTEAWETKLTEARETIRAELREEFAGRYEHDKNVMVEALDKMVTEQLSAELNEFAEEKKALAGDRVKFKTHMIESAGKFNDFLVTKLAEEIKELRSDRKTQTEAVAKLEKFVIHALAEEIKEFDQDKKAVVETKVKLVAEAKQKLADLQGQFVKRSANLVKEAVANNLGSELAQLKEDIQTARENMFGRRLFEAFASEFAVTHLSENKEFAKLKAELETKDQVIAEGQKAIAEKEALVESKNREVKVITESITRKEKLAELFKPLNKEKADVMSSLLEGVQTERLQAAYEKYLPAVLNNSSVKKAEKPVLAESRVEVTGDKSAKDDADANNNVIEIRRLAGLKQ